MKYAVFAMAFAMAAICSAHAADSTGKLDLSLGYVSAPELQKGLEQNLSAANKKIPVSCSDVVTVRTGGTMGSVTAGRCSFGGKPAIWACRNDMTGGTAKAEFSDERVSDGFNLAYLIITSCVGG